MTFQTELREYVLANPKLVTMRPAGDGLFVLKYARRVFYDNLWNSYLESCRGTIVDSEFNVVSRPFEKIYNFRVEDSAPKLDDSVIVDAYRKVNGFMAAITWHHDRLLISTTGSTTSNFIGYIEDLIGENRPVFEKFCREHHNHTWLFEAVHERDPHIIVEKPGLYLLGWREKSWNSVIEVEPRILNEYAQILGTEPVEHVRCTIGEIMNQLPAVKHEGYVMYTDSGVATKTKSPYYLVSKFMARVSSTEKLLNHNVKRRIDEEYYPLLSHIRNNIEEFTAKSEQDRLKFIREFLNA